MKNYTITVNGNVYDVTVEEKGASANTATPAPSAPVAPKAESKPTSSGNAGDTSITAPMPGKVMSIKKSVGEAVNKGETIMVFEAMKMENSVVAPQDGTIASLNVEVGSEFEAGEVLATM